MENDSTHHPELPALVMTLTRPFLIRKQLYKEGGGGQTPPAWLEPILLSGSQLCLELALRNWLVPSMTLLFPATFYQQFHNGVGRVDTIP